MLKRVILLSLFLGSAAASVTAQTHRIGIRTVGQRAEFFDRVTMKKFVPRGNNYIRLANLEKLTGGEFLYHSTFNPGMYDTTSIAAALRMMREDRYNAVRVFLNYASVDGIGGSGDRLSKLYMDNVVNFLRRAKANNIYVLFTIDWLPIPKRVSSIDSLWCPDFQCTNAHILTPEGLAANKAFFTKFIKELKARSAPLDAILAYELRNELTFDPQLPPLSLASGTVKTANGRTYDLTSPVQRNKMVDEGLVYWIDQVRTTIRALDPTALVTVGFIPPKDEEASFKSDKLSRTNAAFRQSRLDFIDVHIYPGADGANLQEFIDRFGLKGIRNKPIVMGEFGVFKLHYPSSNAAARELRKWQAASHRYGFSGWLLWAWDLHELPGTYSAQDENGFIDRAMAPLYRPDPAADNSAEFPERDLALGKPVTTSKAMDTNPASNAVDGTALPWLSGDAAPQWIEIDLQKPEAISMIRLMVVQTPAGETIHEIWVRGPSEEYRMLQEIRENTSDSQILEYPTPDLTNIRFIKIVTPQSPSWVGWREIEVMK